MTFYNQSVPFSILTPAFGASVLGVVGGAFLAPVAAQAQTSAIHTVLGMSAGEASCEITLISSETPADAAVEVAVPEMCGQDWVGKNVRPTFENRVITAFETVAPPPVATILRADAGDRACYLDMLDPDDQFTTQFATFEICEQNLAGQEVQLTYGTSDVLAYACNGDLDCGQTEVATLITQAEAIAAPAVPLVESPADESPTDTPEVKQPETPAEPPTEDTVEEDSSEPLPEEPVEGSTEQDPAEPSPTEPPTEEPIEEPTDLPTEEPPIEAPAEEPVEDPTTPPVEEPTEPTEPSPDPLPEDPAEDPAEEPAEEPVEDSPGEGPGVEEPPVEEPAESPAESSTEPESVLISNLPDGNYRYWSGTSSEAIVPDEELLANGGVTFTFRKEGNNITGIFGYVDGEAICVQGQANENTVTGRSVQNLQGAAVLSDDETFANFGPSGLVQVRLGEQLSEDVVRYSSTIMDLSTLNRINAGTRVPPNSCSVE